ncbi:MAG: hypothetical protein VX529_08060 [Pseudomonadota bacterium]|nr:hypothetical protein [Pseudomonadota bacterium]
MSTPRIHFRGNERFPHGSPTLRRFLLDTTDVRLVEGPVESGKTVGCIGALYKAMCEMPRCLDGIRRSRWLIVRPTYSELETTVRRDWIDWFNQDLYGKMTETEPFTQTMRFLDVEAEIVMMSFKDASEASIKRLKSTQFTGAWVNECQFAPLRLIVEIIDRTGRYPRKVDCPEYDRRKFAVLDNNAPFTRDHWLLYMRGDTPIPDDMPPDQAMAYKTPHNWKFFKQPPAVFEKKDAAGNLVGYELNPRAENLQNMGEAPYSNLGGKARDQIDRDYRNIATADRSGAPRYPDFSRDLHVSDKELTPYDGAAVQIGVDPGGSPGFTIGQSLDGRVYIYHSEEMPNTETLDLARRIKDVLNKRFPFHRQTGISVTGDPVGGWGSLNTKKTTKDIFAAEGLPYDVPAQKDQPGLRMSTGREVMRQMVRGSPKLVIDGQHCRHLIAALDGGMQMKPDGTLDKKSLYANCGESFEYWLWGAGEAKEILARPEGSRRAPIQTIPKNSSAFTAGKRWSRPSARVH